MAHGAHRAHLVRVRDRDRDRVRARAGARARVRARVRASIAPCARRKATRPLYDACRWRSTCLAFFGSCGLGGIGTLLPARLGLG